MSTFLITKNIDQLKRHGQSLVESSPCAEMVVADKGYDSQALRELVSRRNAKHFIPRKGDSKTGNNDIDWAMYR